MKAVLVAVTGLSPAIVTETLWALARRKPRLLPQRVAFITTATGAGIIEKQLFTPRVDWKGMSVWDALRKSLKAGPDELIAEQPHIISIAEPATGRTRLLDDIRTPEENAAAAEFIFARVWDVVRDKDLHLIASVAGGRKTMGALLHSAVSLIGRQTDLLTHVLVDPPFDTLPGFFFPNQPGGTLEDRGGKAHDPANADPLLAEVPFVPLRNRFKQLDDLPGSFLTLRDALSERLAQDAERLVPILIDHHRGRLTVDGNSHKARHRALAILHFILKCNERASVPPDQNVAADSFNTWFQRHRGELGNIGTTAIAVEDIRRELNYLRDLLKRDSWMPASRTLVQAPFCLEVVKI